MYKVVQVFETVEKVLKYDHQKLKQFSRILLNGSFIMQYKCIKGGSNILVCGKNRN